jgi:hypothetical protein
MIGNEARLSNDCSEFILFVLPAIEPPTVAGISHSFRQADIS